MKDLLFEIGTEEVPAHAMPGLLKALAENAEKSLKDLRLSFESIKTLGTPRRIALIVSGLSRHQADVREERRGPSIKAAYGEAGELTRAALGFARGQHVTPADLVKKDGYVYAVVFERGQETEKLLPSFLTSLVTSLPLPSAMRWGSLDFKFIRPLRWLVALYGEDVVPLTIAGVTASRTSRGHRFLGSDTFDIAEASDYVDACEREFVTVDQERRRTRIKRDVGRVAREAGGFAEIDEDLLEEVNFLVEYPTALAGSFDEKYLSLPPEAVITPMKDYQRYFPVKDQDGKLMPRFVTVRDGGREFLDVVRHGNERVLRARLEDARFFYDEDRKKSLEEHIAGLKDVVFQEGLGSVYDKGERLVKLSEKIAALAGSDEETTRRALRAAHLAKADLVTGMVTEFTELQGVMGRAYALLDGEDEEVAAAIDEHYKPRFAGDSVPKTSAGRILSLADKVDNIVATFSRGLIPTGSQDPFALRRQALGIVHLMVEAKMSLPLSSVIDEAMSLLSIRDEDARKKMHDDVAAFMRLRLKNVLSEADVRYDAADAATGDIDDIYAAYSRALALSKRLGDDDFSRYVQSFVRVSNIAGGATSSDVDEAALSVPEEKSLFEAYQAAKSSVESAAAALDFAASFDAAKPLAEPIDAFFGAVMVMDEDEEKRKNRLGLLASIDGLLKKIADFGKIVS